MSFLTEIFERLKAAWEEHLLELAEEAARSPSVNEYTAMTLRTLATHPNVRVRLALAQNPHLRHEYSLLRLVEDNAPEVRRTLAHRNYLPQEVLEKLAYDPVVLSDDSLRARIEHLLNVPDSIELALEEHRYTG